MKRIYLKEGLKTYNEFTALNESADFEINPESRVDSTDQNIEEPAITGDNLSTEIDTILDKLKELEDGIEEELSLKYLGLIENRELLEAEDSAIAKIKDFLIVAPKVVKMQKKANKVRLNKEVLTMAANNPEIDGKKKESLKAKVNGLKDQLRDLENAVDTYQKDAGGAYSSRKLKMTKIEGQLGAIKKKTGMSDDPSQQKTLQQDAQELSKRYKEEVAATKEIADADKPNPEEVKDFQIKELQKKKQPLTDKKEETTDEKAKATLDVAIAEIDLKIAGIKNEGEADAKKELADAKQKLADIEAGKTTNGEQSPGEDAPKGEQSPGEDTDNAAGDGAPKKKTGAKVPPPPPIPKSKKETGPKAPPPIPKSKKKKENKDKKEEE